MKRAVWIGVIHIIPSKSVGRGFRGAKGAYVNVAAWVSGAREYRQLVSQAAMRMGMQVTETSDVESWKKRLLYYRPLQRIMRLASKVNSRRRVAFDNTFYVYPEKK